MTLKKVGEKLKISRWLAAEETSEIGNFVLISTHYIRADMIWIVIERLTSVLLEMYEIALWFMDISQTLTCFSMADSDVGFIAVYSWHYFTVPGEDEIRASSTVKLARGY